MDYFKLSVVYSAHHMTEDVFNNERAARQAFKDADLNPNVWGAKLHRCEFVNGKLETADCILKS